MTLAGIEPATFRLVAQHLNQCATLPRSPCWSQYKILKKVLKFTWKDHKQFNTALCTTAQQLPKTTETRFTRHAAVRLHTVTIIVVVTVTPLRDLPVHRQGRWRSAYLRPLALQRSGWAAPRPDRFTPEKSPVPTEQETG